MRADILTKGFLNTEKWAHALMLINHVDPKTFWTFLPNKEVITIRCNDAPKAGGTTKDLAEVAAPADTQPKGNHRWRIVCATQKSAAANSQVDIKG